MNVISRKKLKDFCDARLDRKSHAAAFNEWFKIARKARWANFSETKATFGQTDVYKGAKKTATIFDIGGNKYRIITKIDYLRQTVLIDQVLTHRNYDKNKWKADY